MNTEINLMIMNCSRGSTFLISGMAFMLFVSVTSCDLFETDDSNPEWYEVGDNISIRHEVISSDLNMPWQMTFADDGMMFLTERVGRVRLVKDGVLREEPLLDMSDDIKKPDGELLDRAGLQGIALHPDFSENGLFYIGHAYYDGSSNLDLNRLLQYQYDAETESASFQRIVLDSIQGDNLHNAARLKFGPDNKLYWSVGDAFVPDRAQDLSNYSGKILRMNADGSVPTENPFPESHIYSFGHRNPQGFDWNPKNGDLIATEHGPSSNQGCCRDEINLIKAGGNYGWPIVSGDSTRDGLISPIIHSGHPPNMEYDYSDTEAFTWAPSGATFVTQGPWKGVFLVASLRQKLIQFSFDEDYNVIEQNEFFDKHDREPFYYGRIRSVNEAPDGTLYMITSNQGRVDFGDDYLIKLTVKESEN